VNVVLAKYYWSGQIEKNEMGGACGTSRAEERWGNLRERDRLEHKYVIGKII
jgi:hypothetical protein